MACLSDMDELGEELAQRKAELMEEARSGGLPPAKPTTLDQPMIALLVLAIGSGSLFLSHVNDAGFWLIKEYFGLSIPQTLKSWTVLECLISVTGLAGVLVLGLFV